MQVPNGSTDITTYWVLRDSTNHVPQTDIAPSAMTLRYIKHIADVSASVAASALATASAAHADNKAIHVAQGVYRVDWPDICFSSSVGKLCQLIVSASGVDTTFLEVELTGPYTGSSIDADVATIKLQSASILADTTAEGVTLTASANTTVADAALTRDWELIADTAASRSSINALRALRNKWSISGAILTITAEDDTTPAWTANLTSSSDANPVTGVAPA